MLCTNYRFGMRQIICTHPALVIFIELIHHTKNLIASAPAAREVTTSASPLLVFPTANGWRSNRLSPLSRFIV